MALQGSGQIKLSEIATEYGGSAPHALSEYHSKGNAPASGEIQIALMILNQQDQSRLPGFITDQHIATTYWLYSGLH